MKAGRACQSFIFCAIVLLIVQHGCARKLTSQSEDHGKLREALNLQALPMDGPVGIIANVSKGNYCDGGKLGKCLEKEEDDDDEDEDHKIKKGKEVFAKGIIEVDSDMDPEVHIFFKPDDLQVGKTKVIYFSKEDSSKSPKLLSREEADRFPFTLKQLPTLLDFFSFPKHSPQAKAMKNTLKQCELQAMKGETKFCSTSLESLLDSARSRFGLNTPFKVLSTIHLSKKFTAPLQNYTVIGMKELSASKMIACHPLPFPFVVFYCHGHEKGYRLFEFSLRGKSGERVEAPAVCHLDTSMWDSDHLAFRFLQVKPGTSPVCHFFPSNDLLWVSLPAAD